MEPSNAALLQPIIPRQNFPDSFFYHIPPPKHPTGTFHKDYRVVESKHKTLMSDGISICTEIFLPAAKRNILT